jgi:hypothetical protein
MSRSRITPELCRQLLRYEPLTGKLYWRERPAAMFKASSFRRGGGHRTAEWAANSWNCKWAGREAFTARNEAGYHVGAVLGVTFRAHRVAWAITHGCWPPDQIDHDDGDRANNRLQNLKPATNRQNHLNEGLSKNNSSGVIGVHRCKPTGRWIAAIKVNGRNEYLGRFPTIEQAAQARRQAEERHGFNPQHGRRPAYN